MIYCIGNKEYGICKIGHSTDVEKRLVNLKTGNHLRLEILAVIEGGYAQEQILHYRFTKFSLEGEWFTLSDEILKFFRITLDPFFLVYDDYSTKLACATDFRVFIALVIHSTFNTNVGILTSETRQEIIKLSNITTQNLSNSLKRILNTGLIYREDKKYTINPFFIWKGYPENRRKYIEDNIELITKQFNQNQEEHE